MVKPFFHKQPKQSCAPMKLVYPNCIKSAISHHETHGFCPTRQKGLKTYRGMSEPVQYNDNYNQRNEIHVISCSLVNCSSPSSEILKSPGVPLILPFCHSVAAKKLKEIFSLERIGTAVDTSRQFLATNNSPRQISWLFLPLLAGCLHSSITRPMFAQRLRNHFR